MRYKVSWKELPGQGEESDGWVSNFWNGPWLLLSRVFFLSRGTTLLLPGYIPIFYQSTPPCGGSSPRCWEVEGEKKRFGTQLVVPFVWSRWSRKRRGVDNEVMFVLLRDEKFEHKAQVKVNPNPHCYDNFYSTVVDNMDSSSSEGCNPEMNSYKCVKNLATHYFSISSIKTDLCSYICVCACVICSLWVGLLPKRARSACDYKLLNIYQNMESVAKHTGGKKIKSHLWGNGYVNTEKDQFVFFY